MGTIIHYAIVVTSWDNARIQFAHKLAVTCGLQVTSISDPDVSNGHTSFLIVPIGSKLGWADQRNGDEKREKWKKKMKASAQRRSTATWVEVEYGETEAPWRVTESSQE